MVNSFKIFDEIQQKDQGFRPDYGRVGYGSDMEIAVEFRQWKHDHNDKAAVERLSEIVLMTPDSRTAKGLDKIQDLNGDGQITHADRFLHDWDAMQKRKEGAPRMRGPGERSGRHDENDVQEQPDGKDAGDVAVANCVDPLLEAIWAQLPKGTSREKAEEVKLAAKIGGIERPDQFARIDYKDNDARAFVRGRFDGFRADVDLSTPAPSLQATQQREQTHDQEQALMWERFAQQQAQIDQNGPKMTPGGRGGPGSPKSGSTDS